MIIKCTYFRSSSITLDKETVSARYLLLHTFNNKESNKLFKIISQGPKVFSENKLRERGYPFKNTGKEKNYLVIEVAKAEETEFKNLKWEFRKLKNYKAGRESFKPFTASLTELMSTLS